jgi:hypothetical protein
MNNAQRLNFITRLLFLTPYLLIAVPHNSHAADQIPNSELQASIGRLPTILADICRENFEDRHKQTLVEGLLLFQGNIDFPDVLYRTAVINVLSRFNSQGNYIFPGTVIRLIHEYNDACQKKTVPSRPYDKTLEIASGTAVMNRFPSELKAVCNIEKHITKKLVSCAYILENIIENKWKTNSIGAFEHLGSRYNGAVFPDDGHNTYDIHGIIEYYIRCKFQNDNLLVTRLTDEFIEIFSKPAIDQ